jgi:hypothetical protein
MNWKKGIIAGLVAGVVILIIGNLSGFLFAVDYTKTPELWKPMTGNWLYNMIAIDFVEGIIYGIVFTLIYSGIPGNGWKKGLNYGLIVWLVATVPGMLMTYFTMAVPDMIVVSWTVGGLISLVIAGPVIAIIHDKIK